MRRFLFVILILILSLSSIYAYETDINLSVDLSTLDAAWNKALYTRFKLEANLTKELSLAIPITYCYDFITQYSLLSVNFDIYYHPIQTGPFVGLSIYSFVWLFSKELPENLLFSNSELTVGYTWFFYKNFFIEPSLIIRNPCNIYSDFEDIQKYFPKYSKLRFQFLFGYSFKNLNIGGKVYEKNI